MIKTLAIIAFGLAIFGLIHHYAVCGEWWHWSQFWHHETMIAMCLVAGISLLVGKYFGGR